MAGWMSGMAFACWSLQCSFRNKALENFDTPITGSWMQTRGGVWPVGNGELPSEHDWWKGRSCSLIHQPIRASATVAKAGDEVDVLSTRRLKAALPGAAPHRAKSVRVGGPAKKSGASTCGAHAPCPRGFQSTIGTIMVPETVRMLLLYLELISGATL